MNKELSANTALSHYRIVSKVGAGGMGEVYLAEDMKLNRKVALKILPADVAANRERMERFVREAKSAAALNHPHIAHVYEIGESEGRHFIAMEFIDGETLSHRIHRDRAPLSKLLKYLNQVAEGLAKAHAAGIVHRDLKPDNIMITRDDYAKVLDFGLAKLIEPEKTFGYKESDSSEIATAVMQQPGGQHSTPGMVMGTIGYMSPEQASGRVHEIDQRSDIFSFGCILFEVVTGQKPFQGKDALDSLHKIVHAPTPQLKDVNPLAPDDLQRMVRRCLAKEPEKRYQSIKELAIEIDDLVQELKGHQESEYTSQLPSSAAASTSGAARNDHLQPYATANGSNQTPTYKYLLTGLLILMLAVGGFLGYKYFGTTKQIESIAVMPFVNDSGNADVEYLSDGMTETLISSLSQLPNLNVKARSSVFRYKGKATDAKTVGRELNVQAILNGRVVQRGDQLILSLELVDVLTENAIWSQQYNRQQTDLVALQSEIARDVSSKLKLKLSGADEQMLNKTYTTSPEAYQLYLKGRFHWNKLTPDDLHKSIGFFQQAIDKDPAFALAYVGLSDTYMLLGIPDVMLGVIPPQESVQKARHAAEKALEIDPMLAEAFASRAHVKWKERDWTGADEDFKRSIALNGNYSNAHRFYSIYLVCMGRSEEGLSEVKRAEELEPLSVSVKAHVAAILYFSRRYDEAIEAAKKAVELDSSAPIAHQRLGGAYEQKGMFPEAIAEFKKAVDGSNRVQLAVSSLAHAFALAGKRDEAEKLLVELNERSNSQYVSSFLIAEVYVALRDKETALKFLDKAFAERSIDLVLAKADPRLDPLRDDPRFKDLLKRLNLPE